jgi:hypothetical protein
MGGYRNWVSPVHTLFAYETHPDYRLLVGMVRLVETVSSGD